MKPTLVILAAGMASRYGAMKQIDGVGSHGEPIIDFSIYDAYLAGFRKVVLIIKKEHEEVFRKILTDEIEGKMEVAFAYQDIHNIPCGIEIDKNRVKPWGTTHALLACKDIVKEPFAIINADDYYGRDAFVTMYEFLTKQIKDDAYGMVAYPIVKTLSESGSVTRGVCAIDENHCLKQIQETKNIVKHEGHASVLTDEGYHDFDDDTLVSMNFWGFTPKIFADLEKLFLTFLKTTYPTNTLTSEHVIPEAVASLIESDTTFVRVLSCKETWFGITYKEDKANVVKHIKELKENGTYPDELWK